MIFKAIPFPVPQPERSKLIIRGNLLIDAKAGDKKQARAELEALIDEIREKHGVLHEREEFKIPPAKWTPYSNPNNPNNL